jgi:hypothetical protein
MPSPLSSGNAIPADLNFQVVRGDAVLWTLAVTFAPSAPSANLNDYSITMTAKNILSDPDNAAVFQLTKTAGDITVDGSNHTLAHIRMNGSHTASLPCLPPLNQSVLFYDVQIVGTDALQYTVARGQIAVSADATLATS